MKPVHPPKLVAITLMIIMTLPLISATPVKLWEYSDQCAVFSMDFNENGNLGLAFGYDAELLGSNGSLLMKAPSRGISYAIAVSNNNVVVTGTEGKWIQAFSNGKFLWEHKLEDAVVSVDVSPDGNVAVAGDASGYVYLVENGKLRWEKKVGGYVWSVLLYDNQIYAGTTKKLVVLGLGGNVLKEIPREGDVRQIVTTKGGLALLEVPDSEDSSRVIAITPDGEVLWERDFDDFTKAIDSDGEGIAVAGYFGSVLLLNATNGEEVYSLPYLMAPFSVSTWKGYTLVSGDQSVDLIAPNGSVLWEKTFNGSVYHVKFSPTGFFVVEYGSHDLENCYSVITAWRLSELASSTLFPSPGETTTPVGGRARVNKTILALLGAGVVLMLLLLWRERER